MSYIVCKTGLSNPNYAEKKVQELHFLISGSADLKNDNNIPRKAYNDNFDTTPPSCSASRSLSLCIYVVVGFTAGITIVLVFGGVVICCVKRLGHRRLANPKKTRLRDRTGRFRTRNQNFFESNFGTGGIEESSGLPDEGSSPMSQSSWYDSETESTNRKTRCQKCGAMVSTSTLDKLPEKQIKSNTVPKRPERDFTWKGLIDGTEEVINTELRAPPSQQGPQLPLFFDSQPLFNDTSEAQDLQRSSKTYQVLTTAEIESGKCDMLDTV